MQPLSLPIDAEETADVLVVGGGVAAVCAAIACARNDADTALIEMDPCLGGNSSPLLGVHVSGAHSFHPYASETGIIEELELQAAYLQAKTRTYGQHYNISMTWHLLLLDALREAGVRVFLNHQGRQAVVENKRIQAVYALDTEHFLTRCFRLRHGVIDASGDGVVARSAGAPAMYGTESQGTFGERSAAEAATDDTMGTSITALVRKCSEPVDFRMPPRFAARARQEGPPPRLSGYPSSWNPEDECCFLWVTESGGERNTILDSAEIREEILYQLYRTWDNVKNVSFPEKARNWELIWVSPKSGKRESFRFVGDKVLTQTDVEEAVHFNDSIGYGGYGVDIHEPDGKQANVVFHSIPPLWNFPYRCTYSRDLENLWFAGRLMSVSHIALGTVRLMRTLGAIGQAVGTAAALAKQVGCSARTVGTDHIEKLQQTLLRQDATILNYTNQDRRDLARDATVTATSEQTFNATDVSDWAVVDRPMGIQLWHWGDRLDSVSLYVRNESDQPKSLKLSLECYQADKLWKKHNAFTRPDRSVVDTPNRMEWGYENRREDTTLIAVSEETVEPHSEGWCEFSFHPAPNLITADPTSDENHYNLVLDPCEDISIALDKQSYDGSKGILLDPSGSAYIPMNSGPSYIVSPAPVYGEAINVVDGHNRRYSTNPVHMWLSQLNLPLPQAVTLTFPTEVELNLVSLTFDTIERAYRDAAINCGNATTGRCVRDYQLEVQTSNGWISIVHEKDNYQRFRLHRFEPVRCQALRLTVLAMNDPAYKARVYEIRAYGKPVETPEP